jgi:hypothetical protein
MVDSVAMFIIIIIIIYHCDKNYLNVSRRSLMGLSKMTVICMDIALKLLQTSCPVGRGVPSMWTKV